jgi:hypothetical protein
LSPESRLERVTSLGDKDIPSMLEIASQLTKVLRRVKKHAETCSCCKEALESKGEGGEE